MRRRLLALSLITLVGCNPSDPGTDGGPVGNDTGIAPIDTGVAPIDMGTTVLADTGALHDSGGADGGDVCGGATDGTACGTGLICLHDSCATSMCGDGFKTTAEQCDDGNQTAFDGCEPGTCTFTCSATADCDDTLICNGAEMCSAAHICAAGPAATDGTTCTLDAGGAGVCHAGGCVAAGCGNGVVDTGEDCDDGNAVNGDGCDTDCTFSCLMDVDCSDGDVCNGSETCTVATHVCVAGTAMACADTSACTTDACDPIDGCTHALIDADGDGHAASSLGACGDDCDDTRASVYPGAEELCDGIDNNCNGDTDETQPTWYIDCDNDGYAASTTSSRPGCVEPPASATGCGGGWTATRPVSIATTDCHDNNANVHPGQTAYFTTAISGNPAATAYDYDCNGNNSREYTCGPSTGGCSSTCGGGYTVQSTTNPNGCVFSCTRGLCRVTSYPECGESASYTQCLRWGGGCAAQRPLPRQQACH